eukprot:CAMPEP_0115180074 /NCGR_PEP_ID=MMETSP0270-20121206/6734_1 /TAXON_ID=71861 /ORGANISM="Scrippsiella trochoidea, Strain CCMP3099" /LENGTH=116 /DNA_ID=CAMNT_0002593067 /DNA_START=35 /DNA_END=385 /DNA_ORIENTATION=-
MTMGSQCVGSGQQQDSGRRRLDEPDVDAGFFLDLHSVSDDFVLRLHDMYMHEGAAQVKVRGLVSTPSKNQVTHAALADGLLSVLLVRDVPEARSSSRLDSSMYVMNLDAPRQWAGA